MTQEELEQLDKLLFKAKNILFYGGWWFTADDIESMRGQLKDLKDHLMSQHSTPESLTILE